jgi:hypothetical protein
MKGNAMNIRAGVAKLGQRREIVSDTRLRRNDPAGKPHPVGVRGFKSHPPHLYYLKNGNVTMK